MNNLKLTDNITSLPQVKGPSLLELANMQMAEQQAKKALDEKTRNEAAREAELDKLIGFLADPVESHQESTSTAPPTKSNVVPIVRGAKLSPDTQRPVDAITKPISATSIPSALAKPVASETSSEPSKAVANNYVFPVPKNLERPADNDAAAQLKALVEKHHTTAEYPTIREEYCRLYILLNNEKLLAPRFRAYIVNVPMTSKATKDLIQRDRIVLECHWLHSRGEHVVLDDDELEGLFDLDKPFDFELAEKFAIKPYKDLIRTEEYLSLTPNVQLQLRAMCGQEMTKKLKAYDESSRRAGATIRISPKARDRQAINRWCEKKPIIKRHFAKHQANAKAQALLPSSYSSFKEIAELSGLMRGVKPEDEKNLKNNLKSFNKYKQEIESGGSSGR